MQNTKQIKSEEIEIVHLDEMHDKINQLVEEGKVEEALKLSEKLDYKLKSKNKDSKKIQIYDDEYMENQLRKVISLVQEHKLKEALQLCEKQEVLSDTKIQVQRITILIKLGRLNEALKVCEKKEFEKQPQIQLQKIKIFVKLENYEEALKVCQKKEFLNDLIIQIQRIKILLKLNRLEEALEVCIMKEICDNDAIKKLHEKAERKLQANNVPKSKTTSINNKSYLITRIYCDDISLDEIEEFEVDDFEKILLTIAYYEKNNKKKGIDFIKNKRYVYADSKKLKTLNILLERLTSKKTYIFDPYIYSKYLNCHIDFDLVTKIRNEKKIDQIVETNIVTKKVEQIKQSKQEEPVEKKEVITPKIVISQGVRVSSRYLVNNNTENQISVKKQELLIKDLFGEEIIEIGKYVYARMGDLALQKKAIEAWDKLEYLANQPVSNKDKLKKMISLIQRLEIIGEINISVDEKRYSKYL